VDVSYKISEILDLGGWNDLQISFKVIKSGTKRKLVYDFQLVVYSNFFSGDEADNTDGEGVGATQFSTDIRLYLGNGNR